MDAPVGQQAPVQPTKRSRDEEEDVATEDPAAASRKRPRREVHGDEDLEDLPIAEKPTPPSVRARKCYGGKKARAAPPMAQDDDEVDYDEVPEATPVPRKSNKTEALPTPVSHSEKKPPASRKPATGLHTRALANKTTEPTQQKKGGKKKEVIEIDISSEDDTKAEEKPSVKTRNQARKHTKPLEAERHAEEHPQAPLVSTAWSQH